MAGHPLRPATDHRLGRPLPHQPANPPQAPPKASGPKTRLCSHRFIDATACGLTHHFWWLSPTSGQITHVFLTRPPRDHPKVAPFDLHALGTPPALLLSQDQTLHQISTRSPDRSAARSPRRSTAVSRRPPPVRRGMVLDVVSRRSAHRSARQPPHGVRPPPGNMSARSLAASSSASHHP